MIRQLKPISAASILIVAALTVYFLIVGKDLLTPLAFAILVWYVINAIAGLARKPRIGNWRPAHGLATAKIR